MDSTTLKNLIDTNPDLRERLAAALDNSGAIKTESPTIPKYYFALRKDLEGAKKFLPTKANPLATGWDVRAAFGNGNVSSAPMALRPGQKALIPLGFRGFCPPGWWYELKPRSSTFAKKSLHCLYGTIDEDFEGQLCFSCQYIPDVTCLGKDLIIEFGDALGQLVPQKRWEAEMLEASNEELDEMFVKRNADRGTGGFGSTGK